MLKQTIAAAAVLICMGGGALAQQSPPVIAELKSAQKMLQGDPTSENFRSLYPVKLATDLTGTWFPMAGLGNMNVAGQRQVSDECENDALDFDASNPFEIKMSRHEGTADAIDTYFNNMGGMLYAMTTDVHVLETINGYDATQQKDRDQMVDMAANFNGVAVLLRPSADVLIIEVANTTGIESKAPVLLGRCND